LTGDGDYFNIGAHLVFLEMVSRQGIDKVGAEGVKAAISNLSLLMIIKPINYGGAM
jgi:hypothetical protein